MGVVKLFILSLILICEISMGQAVPFIPSASSPATMADPIYAPNPKIPPPFGLTFDQTRGWNLLANSPGILSITVIQLDASAFTTPSITVNINGKVHLLVGKIFRRETQVVEHPRGGSPVVNPGNTKWQGDDGYVIRWDEGDIVGEINIPLDADGNVKQRYLIQGNSSKGGLTLLIASDLPRRDSLAAPAPAASNVNRNGR